MKGSQLAVKSSNKKAKELSYTQKCLIFANITQDKKKILMNSFDNIPLVKLYTANLKQDNFIYSNIAGGLCFLFEKEDKKINYFLQIYDIHTNTLAFTMQINQKMINDIMKMENNFLCFPTKFHFLGFKFNSKDSHDKFLKILICDTEQDMKKYQINIKSRDFKCLYKDILKAIKDLKTDLEKSFKAIDSFNGSSKNERDIDKKTSFQFINELSNLVNGIEYDEENKKYNIFIDKSFNPIIIKTFIDMHKKTKKKNSLNIKIIFDDYIHIYNKDMYIDLLINNLINNNSEAKKLTIFKREHQKRHNKEDFEESKRINSEYIVSKSAFPSTIVSKDNNDKIRNSAIIPKNNNFNNELKRKGNLAANKNLKSVSTFNKINSIKEEPEEELDPLKNFIGKDKNYTTTKK